MWDFVRNMTRRKEDGGRRRRRERNAAAQGNAGGRGNRAFDRLRRRAEGRPRENVGNVPKKKPMNIKNYDFSKYKPPIFPHASKVPTIFDDNITHLKQRYGDQPPLEHRAIDISTNLKQADREALFEWLENGRCPIQYVKAIGVGPEIASGILRALKKNRRSAVSFLALSRNNLGNTGATLAAELLATNTSIQVMNLNDNGIDERGIRALNEALETNYFLTEMFLFGNPGTGETNWEIIRRNKDNNNFVVFYGEALTVGESERWGRSKLMVIGQGGAGKTSTVRALLNMPFNENWDSTIGADLTKTTTTSWEQSAVNESDFNQVAAKVFAKVQQKKIAELHENNNTAEAEARKKFLEDMKKYDSEEYQQRAKKALQEKMDAQGVSPLQQLVKGDIPTAKPAARAGNEAPPNADAEVVEGAAAGAEGQGEVFAVDAEPENPENFKSKDPTKKLMGANDVAFRYGQKMIAREVGKEIQTNEDAVTFTIWDYGGQKVFYTLHHLFLTRYGVYLLAFDVTKLISVEDYSVKPEAVDYLNFWINSVLLHAPEAPLLLAGTHIDGVEEENRVRFFKEVEVALTDVVKVGKCKSLVHNEEKDLSFFPLDNKNGIGVKNLRSSIEASAANKFYVEQRIPLRWVFVCDNLMEDTDFKGKPWHNLETIVDLAEKFDTPKKEIIQMLKLFNQLGVMVYLDATSGLGNRVVTDPQWLLQKLGLIIRDDMHGMPDLPEEYRFDWEIARNTGIVSETLLLELWNDTEIVSEKQETYNFLVDLMRQSLLLSDWNFKVLERMAPEVAAELDDVDTFYLIPSLIPENKEQREDFVKGRTELAKCGLNLDFSKFFLPTGVFQRIICLLLLTVKTYSKGVKANKGETSDTVEDKEKVSEKEANKGEDDTDKRPLLGPDFAKFTLEVPSKSKNPKEADVFITDLFLEISGKDKIFVSTSDPNYAPKLLQLMTAIITKIKSEVMGGKLKIDLTVAPMKKEEEWKDLKFITETEAKEEKDFKFWFESTNKEEGRDDVLDGFDFDAYMEEF